MDVSDDRGQALQVGAILLFGILIVGLSLYQATIVPSQNERVEFDTYVDANTDMEQLGSGISSAAARDYSTQTAVQTGVSYPTRTLFVNPGPPGNRLRTGSNQTILISNATAVDGEEANIKTYWNGTTRPYQTKNVTFDTDYNQLQVPPIVYESSIIYRPADQNVASSEDIIVSSGTLIQGNRITLVTIEGDLDAGGVSPTVVAEPVSAHTRTVVVTGSGSDDITLTVPSGISNETWNEDILGNRSDVTATPNGSNVDITLDGSQTYELQLASVELRRQSDSSTATEPEQEYVVAVDGDNQTISEGQSAKLTAEVRDKYNNPKEGVDVTFGSPVDKTVTTNSDGRASVQFTPDSTVEVEAQIAGGASNELNSTTFTVQLDDANPTDTTNPATESGDATGLLLQQGVTAADSDGPVVYTLKLGDNVNQSLNITGLRLAYATEYVQSGNELSDGPNQVDSVTLRNDTTTVASSTQTAEEGKSAVFYTNKNFKLEPGTEYDLELELDTLSLTQNKDALIISVRLYIEGGLAGDYPAYIFGSDI